MTGSEHMLHAGGKASALSSFSLEEQKEIEQSPQRWCGGSEVQRTPPWSWASASEHAQHSTEAMPEGPLGRRRARGSELCWNYAGGWRGADDTGAESELHAGVESQRPSV